MKSITQSQEHKYGDLQKEAGKVESSWNPYTGTFRYIKGNLRKVKNSDRPDDDIVAFLDSYDILFCQTGTKSNFEVYFSQKQTDGNIRYRVNFNQDGIPVIDGQLSVLIHNGVIVEVRSNLDRLIRFTGDPTITEEDVVEILRKRLSEDSGYNDFVDLMQQRLPTNITTTHVPKAGKSKVAKYPFPLQSRLRKVYKKVTDGYHLAWMGLAYLPIPDERQPGVTRIDVAEFILDATDGNVLYVEPTEESVETPAGLTGVPVILPSGTPYSVAIRGVEDGGNYYLKNVDNDIEIITYNGNGVSNGTALGTALDGGTVDISTDTDDNFDATDDTCVQANRDDSQQPDTDAHRFALASYEFYKSRFDWDGFDNGVDGGPVRTVVHCGLSTSVTGAGFHKYEDSASSNMYGFVKFLDGRCSGGSLVYDFFAGDQCTLAHEYQHALTYFGARKSDGSPGYLYGLTIFGSFREGLSDTFGGLVSGTWQLRSQSPTGVAMPGVDPLRSIEFPRDPDHTAGILADHYDAIGGVADKYYKSAIFSHLAFLVGKGGIHERASRGAQYIPCRSIGTDDTAAIWFNSLMDRFDSLLSVENDERMVDACNTLLETAEDLFGDTSKEYVLLRRAMYAVGVYPWDTTVAPYAKQTYGGEACMIPWGYEWERSRHYLPLDYQRWKSIDLFIDNGAGPTYDANIDAENMIYARVRNIGDETLNSIRVEFYYRKYGSALPTSETDWRRCQDSSGIDCTLNVASLAAETNLFGESDYTAAHAANWYLDPDEVSEEVDHFCLKAIIYVDDPMAVNHQNTYNDFVQSNVRHVVVDSDEDASTIFSFMANNPSKNTQQLDLEITHTLPRGATIKPLVSLESVKIAPGEEVPLTFKLEFPAHLRAKLTPPFDGLLKGSLCGELNGPFTGRLAEVKSRAGRISGKIAGVILHAGSFIGRFEGQVDREGKTIKGSSCVLFTP